MFQRGKIGSLFAFSCTEKMEGNIVNTVLTLGKKLKLEWSAVAIS